MTHGVRLRPLSVQDAPVMAEVLADPSLYDFIGGEPPTADDLARLYEIQTRSAGRPTRRWSALAANAEEDRALRLTGNEAHREACRRRRRRLLGEEEPIAATLAGQTP